MTSNNERESVAEGQNTSEGGWGVFGIVDWIRRKFQRRTEGRGVPLTPESLSILRNCVGLLPDGPQKKVFAGVMEAIDGMRDEDRRRMTVEAARQDTVVLTPERTNRDVLLLLEGTMAVHLPAQQETLYCPAPELFGEISMLTGGKPTALVDVLADARFLRIPHELFVAIRAEDPRVEEGVRTIMEERTRQGRMLAALKQTGLDPVQELAEIAMLRMQAKEGGDKAMLLDAVRSLAERARDVFHIESIPAGSPFVRQGKTLGAIRLILDGRANILRHGGRVGIATPGDVIGACDVFTPSRASQFEYSAITDMTVLTVDPQAFLVLRPQVESLVAKQRENLLQQKKEMRVESAGEVSDRVVLGVHSRAVHHEHYVPLRSSGNELIFECGTAEQVLCWLGVRGLLSFRGSTGWEIAETMANDDFLLKRPADKPTVAPRAQLIEENLVLAIRQPFPGDTKKVLETYKTGGLTFEQARFLVERGIVPSTFLNKVHLAAFARSFEHIQAALSSIAEWAEKGDAAAERRTLAKMLQFLLIDTTHDIGITTLMKDPASRDIVLGSLDGLLSLPHVTEERFRASMEKESTPLRERFREDDQRWNVAGTTRRTTALKARLLTHPEWSELFFLRSAVPTPKQAQLLEKYVETLDSTVCPTLVRWMEQILTPMRGADPTLPIVTGRTKSAEGVLDKMRRKLDGHRGRESQGDYCLADVPDAVGARVIVKDATALEQAMVLIENTLKDRIYEKDDFYGNPRKQLRSPYRLVTYTVRCQGFPAEIQLQTLPSAIIANIDHDIIYKPYVPASLEERRLIDSLHRRSALAETEQRLSLSASKRLPPDTAGRDPGLLPMRHTFQSSSPEGVCVCAYVAEGELHWVRDLADARDYFRWYRNGSAMVTTHQGSSVIDCCACIGAPTWQEFRAVVVRRLRERTKIPEAVDALLTEDMPLFFIEEFVRDLEVEANEASFRVLIRERYTPEQCTEIEKALAIAKRAHAGQSYANDKRKPEGGFAYPSSMLLMNIPYVNHCIRVARMAVECGVSADGIRAELLHDAIEDNPDFTEEALARETSPEVASRVARMSRGKTELREHYMARVRDFSGEDKIDKALDRYHNLLRAFNLRDSEKYLHRIVDESKTIFAGDFAPNATLARYAVRFQMLLENIEKLRNRTFGAIRESER